jgi:hypothetical protein
VTRRDLHRLELSEARRRGVSVAGLREVVERRGNAWPARGRAGRTK